MAYHSETHHVPHFTLPTVRRVERGRPWIWLAEGWNDFTHTPGPSMGYGMLVSAVMILSFYLLQTFHSYYLAVGLMAGFVFLGPILAVGLYELSRRIDHNKQAVLSDTRDGWRRNTGSVLALGVILVLLMLTWLMLSMQTAALLYGLSTDMSTLFGASSDWQTFALSIQLPLIVSFTVIGAITVAVTFVLTAVAVPLLIENEELDAITAMLISVEAVRKNPATMTLWAALIGLFTSVAVMPIFLGLIVVFPLLAFASWHAYRDLIEQK